MQWLCSDIRDHPASEIPVGNKSSSQYRSFYGSRTPALPRPSALQECESGSASQAPTDGRQAAATSIKVVTSGPRSGGFARSTLLIIRCQGEPGHSEELSF